MFLSVTIEFILGFYSLGRDRKAVPGISEIIIKFYMK